MKKIIPWWKKGVVYQIYPRSFQDTTGNGIGDLLGIVKKLKYIKSLGVDAIWITPFYMSPQVDNGYDVSDYINVDPIYGTINDFDILIKQAHKNKLKVIIDMVFNHSSTQHNWFKKSLDPKSSYHEYYIWKYPSIKDGGPPNNWKSKFGGNAWTFNENNKKYYLHLWSSEQADLNWENNNLREELKKIIYFWSKRGIDGLRLDVINLVSKPQDFPNDIDGDGLRLYTDGPKIHEYIQEMNCEVFKPLKLMTVGEMSSSTLEHCKKYGNLSGKELSMVFSFDHVEVDFLKGKKWNVTKLDLVKLKKIFFHWQQGMHNNAWNALFWCNHDQPRVVSRWGDDIFYRVYSAKLLAIILHGMQGTPFIYQGEEIGMTNPNFNSISEYKDIESHNIFNKLLSKGYNEKDILKILSSKSRDNGRTPMQWNSQDKHGGFTKGIPWIKMNDNLKEINVENSLNDKNSIFYTYKKIIDLRKKYNVIIFGDYFDLIPKHKFLWCYIRSFKKEKLLVTANFSKKQHNYYLNQEKNGWKKLIFNYTDVICYPNKIKLRPYEAIWWYKKN